MCSPPPRRSRFPPPPQSRSNRAEEPRVSLWKDFFDSTRQVLCESRDPHMVVQLLGRGAAGEGCRRRCARRDTVRAACLFSIFKVPSLLLRHDTLGEVRSSPRFAINRVRSPHRARCQSSLYFILHLQRLWPFFKRNKLALRKRCCFGKLEPFAHKFKCHGQPIQPPLPTIAGKVLTS